MVEYDDGTTFFKNIRRKKHVWSKILEAEIDGRTGPSIKSKEEEQIYAVDEETAIVKHRMCGDLMQARLLKINDYE